jgi:hypothetical protein
VKLRIGPVLLFVIGAVVAELGAFGGYRAYVKPAQGPWLVVAGLLLALLGVVGTLVEGDPEPVQEAPRLHTHGPLAASPEMIAQDRRDAATHGAMIIALSPASPRCSCFPW